MQKTFKTVARITGGIVLLLVGVLGLFLPILQGWLFLGAGLLLLFPKNTKTGRRIRTWMKEKRSQVAERIRRRKGR